MQGDQYRGKNMTFLRKKINNKRDLKHEQEKWHFNIREGRLMDDRQLREGGGMENE